MPKRRKKRRISTALTEDRAENLLGGIYAILSGLPNTEVLFDSELQRRAVYFANKERLIDKAIEERGAGSRPDAFFQYEASKETGEFNLANDFNGANRLKYLIDNNLLFEDELPALTAKYLWEFEVVKGTLKNRYMDKLEKINPVGQYKKYNDLAQVLGGAALKAWQEFIKEAKGGKGKA